MSRCMLRRAGDLEHVMAFKEKDYFVLSDDEIVSDGDVLVRADGYDRVSEGSIDWLFEGMKVSSVLRNTKIFRVLRKNKREVTNV